MLTIRVAAAILFGAFALLAQTPETKRDDVYRVTTGDTKIQPHILEMRKLHWPAPSYESRFILKPDEPRRSVPEITEIGFSIGPSEHSTPLFAYDPRQSSTSGPTTAKSVDSFLIRRKIHKYASFATLPLLAAEAVVGQKLLDEDTESGSLRSAHSGLAAGIGVLFGAETVTGVWNMWKLRKVRAGHKKRLVHGILMLAADAGFVATAASAPGREERLRGDASTHQAIAYTTVGVAAAGYLYILLAK